MDGSAFPSLPQGTPPALTIPSSTSVSDRDTCGGGRGTRVHVWERDGGRGTRVGDMGGRAGSDTNVTMSHRRRKRRVSRSSSLPTLGDPTPTLLLGRGAVRKGPFPVSLCRSGRRLGEDSPVHPLTPYLCWGLTFIVSVVHDTRMTYGSGYGIRNYSRNYSTEVSQVVYYHLSINTTRMTYDP